MHLLYLYRIFILVAIRVIIRVLPANALSNVLLCLNKSKKHTTLGMLMSANAANFLRCFKVNFAMFHQFSKTCPF